VSVERRVKGEVEEWMWIEVPETVKKNLHSVSDALGGWGGSGLSKMKQLSPSILGPYVGYT
jgi:hypothetical protein